MRVSSKLPGIQRQVDRLENAGFKIRVHHDSSNWGWIGDTKFQGVTVVRLDNNDLFVEGDALCSVNDQFDRAVGTEIAFSRALNQLSSRIGRNAMKEIFNNDDV